MRALEHVNVAALCVIAGCLAAILWDIRGSIIREIKRMFTRPTVNDVVLDRQIARAMQPARGPIRRYRVEVYYDAPVVGRIEDYNHFGAFDPDEACRLARAYWQTEVEHDKLRIKSCRVVEAGPVQQFS